MFAISEDGIQGGGLGGGDEGGGGRGGSRGGEAGGKQPDTAVPLHLLLPSFGPQHSRTTPAASSFQEK